MKSNSNMVITGYKVDPTSQEITSLEVNGETVETGSSVELEDNKTSTINVSTYTESVEITPSSGYDAMEKTTVTLSNVPVIPATLVRCTLYNNEETYSQKVAVENVVAPSTTGLITTFSGILYLLYRDTDLKKANYTVSTDISGRKAVILGSYTFTKIKAGWE
jgi:hypothetical protein